MADELRPYIFGPSSSSSSSVGAAGASADPAGEGGVEEEKESNDRSGRGSPLLTISDINPDMLEVSKLSYVYS